MTKHESGALCARLAFVAMAAALVAALSASAAVAGCAAPVADESSPRVAGVSFSAESSMTEASQRVEIRLTFDREVSVGSSVLDDLTLTLNGSPIDEDTIAVSVRMSANSLTIVLSPAAGAQGIASGRYFALYESNFELSAMREDGLVPSIQGLSGSWAVIDDPVTGTLPSGLAIEIVETVAGSEADGVLAQTTFRVTSPALVRAITWFSPDGGEAVLLKHNHDFASQDASSCAADLAQVVNAAQLGIVARAQGDSVTLTAVTVQEGQIIEPLVVEGPRVAGGSYHAEDGSS